MELICSGYSHSIMLKNSAIDIIICWVSIHELVEEERIEGYPPICWTWSKCMIIPYTCVIRSIDGGLILVEIVVDILRVELECCRCSTGEQ